jgi:YHS domain-containing protein
MFRGKLWFTSSPVQLKKFVASPARYVDAVQGQ